MDEIEHLNELINNISAGALGVGGSLFAVVVFGLYTFIRIMNRSINSNLEIVQNVQRFAHAQEEKRNDTQTALDDISRRLLETSVQLERQKTRAENLEELVNGYKEQCSKTTESLMSQVQDDKQREQMLHERISKLTEHNAALIQQNTQLIAHIERADLMYAEKIKAQEAVIDSLRAEIKTLNAERAKFELSTAKLIASLETKMQLLSDIPTDRMKPIGENTNHDKPTTSTQE